MSKEIKCSNCGFKIKHDLYTKEEHFQALYREKIVYQNDYVQKVGTVNPSQVQGKLYTQEEFDKAVKEWKEKLFALMLGLEIENISKFLNEADIGDYGKLGLLITQKIKQAVKDEPINTIGERMSIEIKPISRGSVTISAYGDKVTVYVSELNDLEAKCKEIIEDLVEFYENERHPNILEIIEKHTGKSWKELTDDSK